jgi:hypothetical protein
MYFDATDDCKLRNRILQAIQEFNGDESLFRGEITAALRASKFILCRGPRGCASELKNNHAWATEQGQPDKVALVVFPVISRVKCHFLQIILKGNPHPKTHQQREKQRQLVKDVTAAMPAQLRHLVYVNFSKTGYQTAESFKDACRALLIAIHKEEDPVANGWMDFYSTPMSDIPRLQLRRMFKFDGSSTHALSDLEFILQMFTRNIIMWPYPPNATAFIQELDQLCLWIFKNHAKKIVKLEIEFGLEFSDLSDPIVRLVWLEDVARAYDADLELFQEVTKADPSGIRKDAHKYECRPDALMVLDDMLHRRGTPWGPVRLAKMLGWALGHALLTPEVLQKSFDACTRDFVFSRPLVKREVEFKDRQAALRASKLQRLAAIGASMRGTLEVPLDVQLPVGVSDIDVEPIHDDKWSAFRSMVLGARASAQLPGEEHMRKLCSLFHSFSLDYDPIAKNTERVAGLAARYEAADNTEILRARIASGIAETRSKVETEFTEWVGKLVAKATAVVSKLENVHAVAIPAVAQQLSQTRLLAGSRPSESAAPKQIKAFQAAFQKQSNSFHKAKGDVSLALQDASFKLVQFNSEISACTAKMFPDPAAPAPAASRAGFDGLISDLEAKIHLIQVALQAITAGDDVSAPAPAPRSRAAAAAFRPAAPSSAADAAGGGAAAAPARAHAPHAAAAVPSSAAAAPFTAAALLASGAANREAFLAELVALSGPAVVEVVDVMGGSGSDDEIDKEVVRFHEARMQAQAARRAAEQAESRKQYDAVMQELDNEF